MKGIIATAHILTDEGKDAVNVTVTMQVFKLALRRWVKIAEAKTSNKGMWQARVTSMEPVGNYIPMLRLIEGGTAAKPKILAQGGYVRFDPRTKLLTVDFGEIERLEETAYRLKSTSSLFARKTELVAGQAKRPGISSAVLVRHMAVNTGAPAARPAAPAAAENAPASRAVVEAYNSEFLKFQANEIKLQTKISEKDQVLAKRKVELNTANSRITDLEGKLAKAVETGSQIKTENELLVSEASRKAPIQDIASSVGAQIDDANRKLMQEKRPYQIGKIELDLRGTVSPDGQKMALMNAADLSRVQAGIAIPGVRMELLPSGSAVEDSSLQTAVPNVVGLTETAVRRILQSVGLRLKAVSKTVGADSRIPVGQSMQQSPAAGTSLPHNNSVLVVFASAGPSQEDNQ